MSVEAMTMVTITGPKEMVDTAIQSLVVNKDFHPENAVKILSGIKKLSPFSLSNPYSELLLKSLSILSELGLKPDYRDFSNSQFNIQNANQYISALTSHIHEIKNEREEKSRILQNNKLVIEQLGHFAIFNVELNDLFNMRYLKFHFGRIPLETYRDFLKIIDNRPDVYFITSGRSGQWVYGAYFALPESYTQIQSIFSSLGFDRIRIDVEGNVKTTANEVINRLKSEIEQAEIRIKELDSMLEEMKSSDGEKSLLYYSWLRFMNDSYEICSYAGHHHGKFYIVGWIPKETSKQFVKECESIKGFACFLTEPKELKDTSPPIKLKKGFLSGIYQPFLEMYGLPAYGEIDPRLFIAITYTVLFGLMFGDIGQGAALFLTGILLWKTKKIWLGRVIAVCGISSTCFGFVYGNVFGNESIVPWGFHVLKDDNTIRILIIAVIIGVVLITICMIMNIINGIRQRDIKKALFSPNGVAGFVFYVGIAIGILLKFIKGLNIFSTQYNILVICIPLFAIFAATPITKLIRGEKDWMPKSLVMFFFEGFFELFETLLSFVSNTVSFLRVGAFAISHVGMMMVVYLLSSNPDGSSTIAGLILGNILVTALEAILVCIQVLRLEYYEMLGRFYEGGGVKFSPRVIDYKAAK